MQITSKPTGVTITSWIKFNQTNKVVDWM